MKGKDGRKECVKERYGWMSVNEDLDMLQSPKLSF
jgi:hypothetical protein